MATQRRRSASGTWRGGRGRAGCCTQCSRASTTSKVRRATSTARFRCPRPAATPCGTRTIAACCGRTTATPRPTPWTTRWRTWPGCVSRGCYGWRSTPGTRRTTRRLLSLPRWRATPSPICTTPWSLRWTWSWAGCSPACRQRSRPTRPSWCWATTARHPRPLGSPGRPAGPRAHCMREAFGCR